MNGEKNKIDWIINNMEKSISVVMPIHNQENIIENIVTNLFANSSENVCEFIFVLDDCTDSSQEILQNTILGFSIKTTVRLLFANDVYETTSCNMGFRAAKGSYIINFQDDMLVTEKNYDQRMMKPFDVVPELLAVSARDAVNVKIIPGRSFPNELNFYNVFGTDVYSPRNIFGIRDIVNRGPIMFDHKKLEEVGYLDERFIMFQDDTELFLRAYQDKGYVSGAYVIGYESPLSWGSTRKNPQKAQYFNWLEKRNMNFIAENYKDIIEADKHNADIILE